MKDALLDENAMRLPLQLIFAFAIIFAAVPAEAVTPELVGCPEGSECARGFDLRELGDADEKILVRKQNELLALVAKFGDPTGRVAPGLMAAFSSWRKYVSDECEIIGALPGGGLSTATSRRATQCEGSLIVFRINHLNNARRCLERVKPANRGGAGFDCLYQLAPLAVPLKHN